MQIESRDEAAFRVLAFKGRLDTVSAPQAEQHLSRLVEQGAQRVVIDFGALEFVSSAGLRILLASAKRLRAGGGELRVCCLNETVQDVFDMSGFSTLLNVFPSVAHATGET